MDRILTLLLGGCLALLLAACQPVAPLATPAGDDPPPSATTDGPLCRAVEHQTIVIGPQNLVCWGLDEAGNCISEVVNTAEDDIFTRDVFTTTLPLLGPEQADVGDLAVVLYEGPGVRSFEEKMKNGEVYPPGMVMLNRNYTLHLIDAMPYSPGHSPFGASPTPAYHAQRADFDNQWALRTVTESAYYGAFNPDWENNPVVVGVFDTSPFTPTIWASLQPITTTVNVRQTDNLTVTPALSLTTYYDIHPGPRPARDHGIFVSSLISGVAPGADIHLYRSLDDHGQGTLFTLIQHFGHFDAYMQRVENWDKRYLVNLSLGASCPENLTQDQRDEINNEASSLVHTLEIWRDRGVVVVAAAGNTHRADTRPDPHFPANQPSVISVGAHKSENSENNVACYSHRADFYLPGGDGALDTNDTSVCLPNHAACAGDMECEYAIMGMVTASRTGLAYWSGTSFAAPLLTGLLAHRVAASNFTIDVNDIMTELGSVQYSRPIEPHAPPTDPREPPERRLVPLSTP